MFRKVVLAVLLTLSLKSSLNGAQLSSGSNRLSRRQRILSILESFQDQEPTAPTFHAARFSFEAGSGSSSRGRSGVASDRAISHFSSPVQLTHSSGWNGQGPTSNRTTPPPTVEPPESPYDLWYYQVTLIFNRMYVWVTWLPFLKINFWTNNIFSAVQVDIKSKRVR